GSCPASRTGTAPPHGGSPPRRSGWSYAWRRPFPRSAPRSRPNPPGRWQTPGTGGRTRCSPTPNPDNSAFLPPTSHPVLSVPAAWPPQFPGREWNRYLIPGYLIFGSLISLYLILRAFPYPGYPDTGFPYLVKPYPAGAYPALWAGAAHR